MGVAPRWNYSKYGVRIKIIICSILVYLIWEFSAIFNAVFWFLPTLKHPGAPVGDNGVKYEWEFRSGLDHWDAVLGMVGDDVDDDDDDDDDVS
jgi:hypothetical protein